MRLVSASSCQSEIGQFRPPRLASVRCAAEAMSAATSTLLDRVCWGSWRTRWGPSEELKQHYPPRHSGGYCRAGTAWVAGGCAAAAAWAARQRGPALVGRQALHVLLCMHSNMEAPQAMP